MITLKQLREENNGNVACMCMTRFDHTLGIDNIMGAWGVKPSKRKDINGIFFELYDGSYRQMYVCFGENPSSDEAEYEAAIHHVGEDPANSVEASA